MIQKYPAHNSLLSLYLPWQIEPTNSQYNVNFSYELTNEEEVNCLIENLQKLIQLRPHLRQTFSLENGQLIATIHENLPPVVKNHISSIPDFEDFEQNIAKEPYDLNSQSSVRLSIVRFNDSTKIVIILCTHHIIMDGISIDIFMQELNLLMEGKDVINESSEEYILKVANEPLLATNISPTLKKYIEKINNIADEINYPIGDKNIALCYADILPNIILKKLALLSEKNSISIFNLLLIALQTFLAKLFNQDNILIRYPVNIRKNKSIPGCFGNTVVFCLDPTPEDTYLSLINSWHHHIDTFKEMAKTMLTDKFNMVLMPGFANDSVTHDGLIIQNKRYLPQNFAQIAHSNLGIRYREQNSKYYFICDIYAGLFPESFSSSLLKRFFSYLDKLLANPSAALSAIDLTFTKEKQKILYDFNDTDCLYPRNKTLVDLFNEIVSQCPNKIAVKAFNGSLTYLELSDKAEQLAGFLMAKGTQPDDIIAILIDNRLEMILAIMGVLKAGAAYLPIAYNMPTDNICEIIKDAGVKFLLTLPHLVKNISTTATIVDMSAQIISPMKYSSPTLLPHNLAYIIYTSGTTGKPKGVMVEHSSVVNYTIYMIKYNKLDTESIGCKYAGFGFDASVTEIYPILLSGGTLCIIKDKDRLDRATVKNFFDQSKITYAFLPTQFAELFFSIKNTSLKTLVVGGDKLVSFASNTYRVVNAYGPAETTVQPTAFLVDKQYKNIPIGKLIDNVKCYVVDRHLNIVPIGMVGELLIGGECLARGYLNNPTLTAEKFIANPFQTHEGKNLRLYKTGDLVRWLPDGNLEYIGRNDLQVKIRDYRIELGEIESKLVTHPEIKQAVVMAVDHFDNSAIPLDKYLVAYYTADRELNVSEIQHYLKNKLAEYMMPKLFVYLDELPLTLNGKINKRALLPPTFTTTNNYLAPSNREEKLVCAAFSKILGLEKIGVNDDFFSLGGNSIKAITLTINLQHHFKINVAAVFKFKTPKKIAKYSALGKNSLNEHLQQIKSRYTFRNNLHTPSPELQEKLKEYYASIEQLPKHYEPKSFRHILLTGATGFLGCNLLEQLLTSTQYTVFLLIRADSEAAAFERVNKKFLFYFGKKLTYFYKKRLFIFAADIEKKNLGLPKEDYQTLIEKTDSIIHSAALTKHYGEYDKFYSTNVQGTINLLELCKLTATKDFHYISTSSVLDQSYTTNSKQFIFTEDDRISNFEKECNSYIRTKYHGEEEVINYRQWGITSSIYRVGNLAFMANNYCLQENIEDNAFFNSLKCLLSLGIIAKEMNEAEISPADLTARAIIKLFDKEQLNNRIHHVFNSYLFNIAEGFSRRGISPLKVVSINFFIDKLISLLDNPLYQKDIERYLLHQGWLNETHTNRLNVHVLQNRTQAILQKLDFEWLPVKHNALNQYLKLELENAEKD